MDVNKTGKCYFCGTNIVHHHLWAVLVGFSTVWACSQCKIKYNK